MPEVGTANFSHEYRQLSSTEIGDLKGRQTLGYSERKFLPDSVYFRVKRISCTELGCICSEMGCRGVVNCTSVSGCLPDSMSYS